MKHTFFLLILSFQSMLGMDQGQLTTTLNRNFKYTLTHTTLERELKKGQAVTLLQFLDLESSAQDCHIFAQFQSLKKYMEELCTQDHPDIKALIALGKGTGILNTDGALKPIPTVDEGDDITLDQLIRLLQFKKNG